MTVSLKTKKDNRKITVLLVDDEPEVTELLIYALRREPYRFFTASSAREALEFFKKNPADILITDIRMPGMDGIELASIIHERYPDTQTIIITAHGDIDTAVEAMKTGATDFLQKPVGNNDLRLSLRSAAEKWRLKQKLTLASKALSEEKELLSITLRSIREGVITTDINQSITMLNRQGEILTGWGIHEARGLPIDQVLQLRACGRSRETAKIPPVSDIIHKKGTDTVSGTALLTPRNSSNPIDISYTISPLRNDNNKLRGTVIVFRDITLERREEEKARQAAEEKARMEAQIQRAQKMEAIGLMAGGVAHDLNNILSGILSYPELMLMDIPDDSPLRKPLEIIKDSGQRAADVVADLLTVARGAAASRTFTNLNVLVKQYLEAPEISQMVSIKPGIKLETKLSDDLLGIECSPVHINKCIMNLIINAIEAIEHRGTITIATENRYIDRPFSNYEHVKQGEYVILSVSDTGSGIAPHDLEHIFEPFYTKKVMGRSGTGIGLAVVWNTMQDHQGYIDVKTGKWGTSFELYFPAARQQGDTLANETAEGIIPGNGQKVLVIDDEPAQRDIACALLERLGYTACSVPSGEDAVEFIKNNSVDILLLDMIMEPGMNGDETYEHISEIRPHMPAVIASGFSRTDAVKRAQELGAGIFIRKPYTLSQLSSAIAAELKRNRQAGCH